MLGLDQVIVVINKMDLVAYDPKRFEEVEKELIPFLSSIQISPSFVIPISAKKGDLISTESPEMKWYKGPTFLEALESFKADDSRSDKPMRFIVQDVYNFDKRIIVGRVESGILKEGDRIKVLPSGEETTVNSIEEYLRETSEAEAGKSVGMTTTEKLFIDRGDVIISNEDLPEVRDRIPAHIFWMDKAPHIKGETLFFRLATQEVSCEIEKIIRVIDSSTLERISLDANEIKNREVADVIIKTDRPVVVENFNKIEELGRFVLGKEDTLAGGIITEVKP
jgi:sulfate adenylyltransferase subunit 1 (EFTu-like GTPase family)